jgi:hypothetical protein
LTNHDVALTQRDAAALCHAFAFAKDYTEGTQLEPSWLRRNDECVDVCGEILWRADWAFQGNIL